MCVSEIRVKRIRVNQGLGVTSNLFYSQQFSLPYSKNILLVCPVRGGQEKEEKSIIQSDRIFPLKKYFCFLLFSIRKNINSCVTSCPLIQKGLN